METLNHFVGSTAFPIVLGLATLSLKKLITNWLVLSSNQEGLATSSGDEVLETGAIY